MPTHVLLDQVPEGTVLVTPVASSIAEGESFAPFARAAGFRGAVGTICAIPNAAGGVERFLVGVGDGADPWALAAAPTLLPRGNYALAPAPTSVASANDAALAWALGSYSFNRYRAQADEADACARLLWPKLADRDEVRRLVASIELVRDMVNTPAADMGPAEVENAVRLVAERYGAKVSVITGEALLEQNYPAVYAVGRASSRPPRLIDLVWGEPAAPKVTLVGKGVCFDSGGLDIKPASSMRLMKKDMGGAAHALALGALIMDAGLPVRLRILIPAVENAVSGSSMRPGDILRTRKGLTVEVSNTDAEGRLILSDALAEGDSEQPDLLLDFATLTGAARVALGPDLPAMMSNSETLAEAILASGRAVRDDVWRLPLWPGYKALLESKIADLDNAPEGGMAGAITAGLFLEAFVSPETPWAHFDLFAWAPKARPGRPVGGEAQALRGLWQMLRTRFGSL